MGYTYRPLTAWARFGFSVKLVAWQQSSVYLLKTRAGRSEHCATQLIFLGLALLILSFFIQ